MALTRQQFDELRAKGLTVDQIIKFESGQVPVTTQAKPNFFQGVGQKLQARGKEFASEIGKAGKGELASTSLGTIARATTRAGSLVGGGLGDILVEGVKAVLPQKTEEKIKSGISNIASQPIPQKVIQSVSSWAEKNPEAAKDLEGALEIAGLIPLTKGIQVGGKAVIQTGKEVAGDISKVAGKTLATTGAVTEKAGKSLVSASFPPTKSQAKAILNYKAKTPLLKRVELASKSAEKAPITPSEVALKYNLIGVSRSEIGAKAKRVANQLFENQVNPVISGIEKKVNVKDLFNSVKKTIDKTADTSKRKSLINAFNSLKDDYKNVSTLSYKKLDQIKSEMSKGLPAKVWQGQDIAGELNNVRKMFSDKAREVIRKELPDNVKRVYDEYGSLVSIMEKGEKSLQRGLDIGVLGLTSEAIRRGATPITTIGGKAINKAGEIIKGVGQRLQKGGTKLKSQGEKGSLLNIKPGLTIEDVSLKGKGETLRTTPLVKNKSILGTEREFSRDLTSKDKIIERKAFSRIDKDSQKILDDYKRKNGKVVNTDTFRPYFKDDGYVGYRAAAVQEPASELSKRAYLDGLKNEGKYATLYAGGSGTGKTSAVKNISSTRKILNNSSVILDGNLSSIGSAIKRITEATNAGKQVPIIYVYRDPVDSLVNGVIKRSINNADEMGRIVPTSVIAENHIGSWKTVSELFNKGFDVKFIDNSLGAGNAKMVKYSDLVKKIKYPSKDELTKIFNNKIKELYESKTKIGERSIRKQEFSKYLKKS